MKLEFAVISLVYAMRAAVIQSRRRRLVAVNCDQSQSQPELAEDLVADIFVSHVARSQ